MNSILIRKNRSIYPIYDFTYPDIAIDGIFLDERLDQMYPGKNIRGLVPPFSGWLSDPDNELILWDRVLPPPGEIAVLPLLICPDDQDYDCLTIVTKVSIVGDHVQWQDFGFDHSYECMKPEMIGTAVEWFPHKDRFLFSLQEYREAIECLRSGVV